MNDMRRLIKVVLLICSCSVASAQSADDGYAIMKFLGTDNAEDIDAAEAERLSAFLSRPLALNIASLNRLKSCGLFTAYQSASLYDYRQRHGDVLSVLELAMIDGFGKDAASVVAPFLDFTSRSNPGAAMSDKKPLHSDIALRSGYKSSLNKPYDPTLTYAAKSRISVGDRFSASFSFSRPHGAASAYPDLFSGYLRWDFRKKPVSIVIGDFNARFGQGLAFWNGMTLSGMNSMASFYRSPSAISHSWSFTGGTSHTGAASSCIFGKMTVSASVAFPGLKDIRIFSKFPSVLPAFNVAWNGRIGHIGLTHFAVYECVAKRIPDMKTSCDLSACIDGIDLFAETAYDWVNSVFASLAGVRFPAGDDIRFATMLRYYPPEYSSTYSGAARSGTKCANEYAASILMQFNAGRWIAIKGRSGFGSDIRRSSGKLAFDASYYPEPKEDAIRSIQLKSQIDYDFMLSGQLLLKVRLSDRFRTWGHRHRTDFRADFSWLSADWSVTSRLNVLKCDGIAYLGYVECVYKNTSTSVSFRQGAFKVDDWDDRIYVYERDAPGSFSVPAMYGRGIWSSLTYSVRMSRCCRIYFRAGLTTYPFMKQENKKPGKAELKIQFQFSI